MTQTSACEQCGAANPAGSRFCQTCHGYLGWDETAAPRRPGPAPGGPAGPGSRPGSAPGSPGSPGSPGEAPQDRKPGMAAPAPTSQQAGVRLELTGTAPAVLPPGGEARLAATVRNTGGLVDEVLIVVEPRVGWIRVEPDRLSLYPGQEQEVAVVLAPPAVPAPPAGPLRFRVQARSALHRLVVAEADGLVAVGAIDALAAYLEPAAVVAKTRAGARVVLRNDGNRPMPVSVFRADPEPGVRTGLAPERIDLLPGYPAEVAVRLRPARRRWRGEPLQHGYRLRVQPQLGVPIDLDGTLVQRPLLARWVLPALLVLVLAPLLAFGGIAAARAVQNARSGGPSGGGDGTTQTTQTSQPSGGDQPSGGTSPPENPPPENPPAVTSPVTSENPPPPPGPSTPVEPSSS